MSDNTGIIVEKNQHSESDTPWHWLGGETYPYRELLKRWGCRWSKKRRAWYYIGETLPDAVQALVDTQTTSPVAEPTNEADSSTVQEANAAPSERPPTSATTTDDSSNTTRTPDEPETEPEEAPKVRVIKPNLDTSEDEPDAIITAIQETKAADLLVLQPSNNASSNRRILTRIPQYPCGELTGSISGSVWCYGYALHDGVCVYVNMGGPRTAVEAIRAKLAKGDTVNCVPWDAPAVELTAGEGDAGKYSDFMQNIPEAKFTSLILLHEMVTQPNYGGSSTTFLFHISDEQVMAQLRHHVTLLVNVPVFEVWTGYLWQAGQSAMLVRKTRCQGGLDVLIVDLDVDSWTRLLTGGLAEGIIALPTTA
jgi:hypothetical protein